MSPTNRVKKNPKIGDVFIVQFDGIESEQIGMRPALVLQNNMGNQYSPNVIVVPMTSKLKRLDLPTHVLVPKTATGLRCDSVVLCESPKSISKGRLGSYLTTLPDQYMGRVAEASVLATSAISFMDLESLIKAWEHANTLNNNIS